MNEYTEHVSLPMRWWQDHTIYLQHPTFNLSNSRQSAGYAEIPMSLKRSDSSSKLANPLGWYRIYYLI